MNLHDQAITYARSQAAPEQLEGIKQAGVYLKPLEYYVFGSVYPPLKAMEPVDTHDVYSGISRDINLYVHIPFCRQYCSFCHFAKEINPKDQRVEDYLDALRAEMSSVGQHLPSDHQIKTIYFGGGTASYLNARQIDRLFADLRDQFSISPEAEITYELHPQNARDEAKTGRLAAIKRNGGNRWVFGAQSMNNKVLEKLNRGHTRQEVLDLVDILRSMDATNISIDLMFGLPYQTTETWCATLEALVDHEVPKFNVFPLMFKSGDPITRHWIKNPEIFPDADTRHQMHHITDYVLRDHGGYGYGPVFYYSKHQKVPSRQQKAKFDTVDSSNLLGIGVSAFGYLGGSHYYNISNIAEYIERAHADVPPVWLGYHLPPEERLRRTVIMSLRSEGVDFALLSDVFRTDVAATFEREFSLLEGLGLVTIEHGVAALTRLGALHADGIGLLFVSNEVMDRIGRTNERIVQEGSRARKNPVERFDYTPIRRQTDVQIEDLVSKHRRQKTG